MGFFIGYFLAKTGNPPAGHQPGSFDRRTG